MMNRAEEWGLRERGSNPCFGIAKNPRKQVARFLDTDELARLGRALDANEARWRRSPSARATAIVSPIRRSTSRTSNDPPLEEMGSPKKFPFTWRLRQFENENASWLHSVTVWLPVDSSLSN